MYQKTNKTGEVYDAKDTYIQKISDLKKSNKELYNELKNLKENPIIITNTIITAIIVTMTPLFFGFLLATSCNFVPHLLQ